MRECWNTGNTETYTFFWRGTDANHRGSESKRRIGQTTTSVNLAATLAEQGRRVLLIDLDPQHSATTWYDVTEGGRGTSICSRSRSRRDWKA